MTSMPSAHRDTHHRRLKQRTATALAFAISPLALWLLYTSVTAIQEAGSTGLPLGAPSGQIGILIAAIGLFLIAHSARWIKTGIVPLLVWSAGFACLFFFGEAVSAFFGLGQTMILLSWSQLPLIVFLVVASTALAMNRQREEVVRNRPELFGGVPHLAVLTVALGVAFTIFTLTVSVAPSVSTYYFLTTRSMFSFGAPRVDELFVGLLNLICACLLPWLALRSQFAAQFAAWLLLIVPSFMLVPLIMTLWQISPTPGNPAAVSWAMATPVTGAVGLVVSACAYGLAKTSPH